MAVLGKIKNEGFECTIYEDADGRVHFTADASIDADGANGQHGGPAAYRVDDLGSDYLENAGMKMSGGKVICKSDQAREIVILGPDNEPKVFPGGMIASKTWYIVKGFGLDDPRAYVDSETVPYIVVPPMIVSKTAGVVRGSKARVTWKGTSVDCVVADKGPQDKIGELSIAAARALGIDPSPRDGGLEKPEVLYELWPGIAAPGYELQPS